MPKLEAPKASETNEPAAGGESPAPAPQAAKKATKAAKKAAPGRQAAAPPARSLLSQGKPLSETQDFVNALYTGDAKTGKTTDVAAMANFGRVAYVNAEGGVKKGPLQRMGVKTENIVSFPPKPEDLTFQYLEDLFWELKGALEDDPASWVGVVWDSVTEIHIKLLQDVRDYKNERALRKGESRTKDSEPGDLIDRFFTDLSDYNPMTDQVKLMLRRFRDLPCHFAATTLLRRDKDDDGHVVYRPAVTPALGKDMLGYFDVIGVTDIIELDGEECYRALFRPLGKFRGGDRFGVLPRRLYDPMFDRVAAYVNGELDADSDPVMQQIAELAQRQAPSPKAVATGGDDDETEEEATGEVDDSEA